MSTTDPLLSLALHASQAIEHDGALRSALRRASCALDIVGLEAVDRFGALLLGIPGFSRLGIDDAEVGMVVIAQRNVLPYKIAHSKSPIGRNVLARHMGQKRGERRLLSELRFQRLLRASDCDDRLQQLRRAIALLEGAIHPYHALEAYLDLLSDGGRRRFARAYFMAIANPEAIEPSVVPVA